MKTNPHKPPLLLTAITDSVSAVLITGQLAAMKIRGFETALLSSPGGEVEMLASNENIVLHKVMMRREIAPIADLVSLYRIFRLFRQLHPEIVNAGTPKAGLLCMLAGFLARVPVRIYTIRGLRYHSEKGLLRKLLILMERLAAHLAHEVIVISPSVLNRCYLDRILPSGRGHLIGRGGSNGVDLSKFIPENSEGIQRKTFRNNNSLPSDAIVIGFVGRLVTRKGIVELVEAFECLAKQYSNIYLVVAGPLEAAQQPPSKTLNLLSTHPRIRLVGFVTNPVPVFSAIDILAHPAYWEGFGNVLLQAAAMGKPIVTTEADGTHDAVIPNETALIIPPRDVPALIGALERYIKNPELRCDHGKRGIEWAKEFDCNKYWDQLASTYREFLARHLDPTASSSNAHSNEKTMNA